MPRALRNSGIAGQHNRLESYAVTNGVVLRSPLQGLTGCCAAPAPACAIACCAAYLVVAPGGHAGLPSKLGGYVIAYTLRGEE
jgi:glucose dehydrogenase